MSLEATNVKKMNDVAHPGHVCIELGVGLIQLLKWIIEDELELGSVAHLVAQTSLCENWKLGLVPRNHVLGATSIEGLQQLMVLEMILYEIDQTGGKEEIASYKLWNLESYSEDWTTSKMENSDILLLTSSIFILRWCQHIFFYYDAS